MSLVLTATVSEYVREVPARARVFEQYGLDYCCGGGESLEAACTRLGIDLSSLMLDLEDCDRQAATTPPMRDWADATLTELTQYIVGTHHGFLEREMPRIRGLMERVVAAHGATHPEVITLRERVRALIADLEPHLMKEENILFPMMRRLDTATEPVMFPFGSIANPIGVMEDDHQTVGQLLREIRAVTHEFTPAPDACPTWRALLEALHALEIDTHQHIHLENNVLHPMAQDRERELEHQR